MLRFHPHCTFEAHSSRRQSKRSWELKAPSKASVIQKPNLRLKGAAELWQTSEAAQCNWDRVTGLDHFVWEPAKFPAKVGDKGRVLCVCTQVHMLLPGREQEQTDGYIGKATDKLWTDSEKRGSFCCRPYNIGWLL